MGRLLVGALAVGLAIGIAVGATHDARGPALPRLKAAILRDARSRYRKPFIRTRCERFQYDRTKFSCTAVEFESRLSYTGKLYIAQVRDDGRFRFHPYGIPIWKGV